MTLITNASLLHRSEVRAGLDALAAREGCVWARIGRRKRGFLSRRQRLPDSFRPRPGQHQRGGPAPPAGNQGLFFRQKTRSIRRRDRGLAHPFSSIISAGGTLARIQVTTVSRRPPHPDVRPLPRRPPKRSRLRRARRSPGCRWKCFPRVRPRRAGDDQRAQGLALGRSSFVPEPKSHADQRHACRREPRRHRCRWGPGKF